MRYYVIINPPQYRDNREDTHIIECEPDYKHAMKALQPVLDDMLSWHVGAFESDEEVNGADMIEAFSGWRERLKAAQSDAAPRDTDDSLIFDLWNFIDNTAEDAPDRQDKFFALRERVRARQRA